MRRLTARLTRLVTPWSLPATLLLLGAGCGAETVPETADVSEVRGAPLFVPEEPAPVPEPVAADVSADPKSDPAPLPDATVGDPSAPLSEPPPPAPADVPSTEPDPEPGGEPDPEPTPDGVAGAEPDGDSAGEPDGDSDVDSDVGDSGGEPDGDTPTVVHATATGSGDSPVDLVFPAPDEKGLIFVTFEQLAAFEYLPPGGPEKVPTAGKSAEPAAPDARVTDDPTTVAPLTDALRTGGSTIPEPIRKLSGKKIEVEGYMIPLRFEDGKVKTFFLSRHLQGCCFGVVPRVNDVIEVEMVADGDAYYDAYMPIIVTGPFEVKEESGDPAYLQTIYYMKAESSRFAEDW